MNDATFRQRRLSTCQVCGMPRRPWVVADVELIHVETCPNPMCRDPEYFLPRVGSSGWTWG